MNSNVIPNDDGGSHSSPCPQHHQQQQEEQQHGHQHDHPNHLEQHSLSQAYDAYLAHDVEEQTHWEDVCRAYRQYATFAMAQWNNTQYRLQHLVSPTLRQYLPSGLLKAPPAANNDDDPDPTHGGPSSSEFEERARLYKDAAIRNQFCLDCILRHAGQMNSQDVLQVRRNKQKSDEKEIYATDSQMSKVSSVLKSLVRDWSAEGKAERDMAYHPILDHVQTYLKAPRRGRRQEQEPRQHSSSAAAAAAESSSRSSVPRLCVPGAGVGRLACELAALGYEVQGNEFSLHMLLASDFILNGGMATPDHPFHISPHLMESRNVVSWRDPPRPIAIPDVDPYQMILRTADSSTTSSTNDEDEPENEKKGEDDEEEEHATLAPTAGFSMAAGEFVSIYSNPKEHEQWDGFVTCFFLDTAPNIVEYITVMHQCLKPGGYVFHFGPLLWHWSGPTFRPDDRTRQAYEKRNSYLSDPAKYCSSIDLSWDDVRSIFVAVGFDVVYEERNLPALYTADPQSMMTMSYKCVDFVARKTAKTEPSTASMVSSPSGSEQSNKDNSPCTNRKIPAKLAIDNEKHSTAKYQEEQKIASKSSISLSSNTK